jgi:uncharacterized protein
MKIGIISDTHGLIPGPIPQWSGIDLIVHAGDIGGRTVLDHLQTLAPVMAVTGNYDRRPDLAGLLLPDPSSVSLGGLPALLTHRLFTMAWTEHRRLYARMMAALLPAPRLVVFGHTHFPVCEQVDDIWFINPGYAGPDPLEGERTAAILEVREESIRAEIFYL